MIHQTAIVSKNAKIGANVKIGPFSIIEDDVEEEIPIQQPVNNENKDIKDIIDKCLLCINSDNYDIWIYVALIINNELGFNGFEILNDWSKLSCNYDYNRVYNFYKNIKPKDNGLKIIYLKKIAKRENQILYKLFKEH